MPRKKLPKDTFVFRDEWLRWLVDDDGFEWSPQECKELLMAIRAYRLKVEPPTPSNRFMKDKIAACINSIRATDKVYEEKCEENRLKAKSYWDKLYASASEEVRSGVPEDTSVRLGTHDNDSDSDSDNDSDKVSIETNVKKTNEKKGSSKKKAVLDDLASESNEDEVEIFQESTEEDYYPNEAPNPNDRGDFAVPRKPATEADEENTRQSSDAGDAKNLSPYATAKVGEIYETNGKRCIKRGLGKVFCIPSIEEIQEYITLKGYHVQANTFFDYYENASPPWTYRDGRGRQTPIKNWKQCLSTFESNLLRKQGSIALSKPQQTGYQVLSDTDYEQI